MYITPRIVPCLWFDDQAEAAAQFYVSVFDSSKIVHVTRYTKAGHSIHKQPPGSVMTVAFELDGQPFTALNGGPHFSFTEAISLQVNCTSQAEIDYYWEKLSKNGDPRAQQCGWLKDQFGLSWQVVPANLPDLLGSPHTAERVMDLVLRMKKLDMAELTRVAEAHA